MVHDLRSAALFSFLQNQPGALPVPAQAAHPPPAALPGAALRGPQQNPVPQVRIRAALLRKSSSTDVEILSKVNKLNMSKCSSKCVLFVKDDNYLAVRFKIA